jgi:hypothetical protein
LVQISRLGIKRGRLAKGRAIHNATPSWDRCARRGADAERERQYGHDRENGAAAQRSAPKAEIISHGAIVS